MKKYKNKRRRIPAAAALCGAVLLGLAGCGGRLDPTASPGLETAPGQIITEAPAPPTAVVTTAPPAETAPPATAAPSAPAPAAVPLPATPPPTAAPSTEEPVVRALTEVNVLQEVLAYEKKDGPARAISAGNSLGVEESEDPEWLTCHLQEENQTFYLHLDPENPYLIETPEGWLYLWVVLDGLDFT